MLNSAKRLEFHTPPCTGLSAESIHLTLYKLETILGKLKVRLKDVFPDEF